MQRTPSQTIGPFFHKGLRWPDAGKIHFAEAGKRIVITGRVADPSLTYFTPSGSEP